jgi:hypothetical protein
MSDARTRRLAVFLAAGFAGGTLLLLALGAPWTETALFPVARFFQGRQASDSWTSLDVGYAYVTGPPRQRALYDATFFSRQLERKGFQYPPTSLLVMSAADAVFGSTRGLLEAVTWLSVPLMAALVALLDRKLAGPRADPWPSRAALAALATLAFYPALRAYANGQVQAWINTLFAGALLAWVCGRAVIAGALVAVMTAFKPQAAFLVLWALARKQWRFVFGFLAAGVPILAASVALYGWAPHLEYLRVLAFLGRRGESFYPNHSVNGLLNRLLDNGFNLEFYRPGSSLWMDHFPPYHRVVYVGTLVTSALLLGTALWPPRDPADRGSAADFAFAAVAATLASPIAWEHHYGVLLPVFVLLLHRLDGRTAALRALAVAWLLASHPWWVTRALAGSPLNVLQSYLLFAGLALLALLRLRPKVEAP